MGGLAILLGTGALVGWSAANATLRQFHPGLVPMHPNTALGFLLCGVGLTAVGLGRPRWALVGGLAALVGLGAWIEYQFGMNLGLNPLLVWLCAQPPQGQVAPISAVAFFCAGAALVLQTGPLGAQRRSALVGLLGSVVVALAAASGLQYGTGLSSLAISMLPTRMAVNTIAGFLVVGSGLLVLAWRESREETSDGPRWLPGSVGIGLLAISVVLSQTMKVHDRARAKQTFAQEGERVKEEFAANRAPRTTLLLTMAADWRRWGKPTEEAWQVQAHRILAAAPSIEFLAWVDPEFVIRWFAARPASPWRKPPDLAGMAGWHAGLTEVRDHRRAKTIASLPLPEGGKGFLVAFPLFHGKESQGAFLGLLRAQEYLESLFHYIAPHYALALFDGEEEVYSRGDVHSPLAREWAIEETIDLQGKTWRLLLWPTAEQLAKELSPFPSLVFGGGLLMTLLVSGMVYLAQAARHRAGRLEAVNRELQEEIAARKQAEQILQRSESRLRLVWSESADGMRLTSKEGTVLLVNDAYCRLVGKPREAIEGCLLSDVYVEDQRDHNLRTYRARFASRAVEPRFEKELRLWDGRKVWVEVTTSFLSNEGSPPVLLSIYRDISERKRAEESLRQAEEQLRQALKMEAIGRLAGGVAHDFNNLLTIVTGYGELLLARLGPRDPLRDPVEAIKKAGDRAAALTRQLLAFSRKQIFQVRVVDLNGIVTDIGKMLRRLIGEDIELVLALSTGPLLVRVDPGQIEQVLMNLAVNARDAMPDGGRLTIRTAPVLLDEKFLAGKPEILPGAYFLLSVQDTGVGMAASTREHLFEPFFTTKEVGKGTGLGLAMAYGVIKQSGGHIEVESEPGKGATFRIYLPRAEEAAPVQGEKSGASIATLPRGTETVLLAEDEDSVRALARKLLQASGYTVLEAQTGGEALQLCERHSGPIHLLVSDVIMPGLNGRQLADRIAARRSGIKVLFVSGYSDEVLGQKGLLEAGTTLLKKPFTAAALARTVRQVLDGGTSETTPAALSGR